MTLPFRSVLSPIVQDVNSVDSSAAGAYATAIGAESTANGGQSLAIGYKSEAIGEQSVALGTQNIVRADHSGAFGDPNFIDGKEVDGVTAVQGSYAFGNDNVINSSNTFVLGNNVNAALDPQTGKPIEIIGERTDRNGNVIKDAQGNPVKGVIGYEALKDENGNAISTVENSVYLGNKTTATAGNKAGTRNLTKDGKKGKTTTAGSTGEVKSASVGNMVYGGFAGAKANGVVSVGASGDERRIQNVAAGEISSTSTDAINGSQLYSVAAKFNAQQDELNRKLHDTDRKLRSGIAGAVAIGSLVQAYNPSDSLLAVGGGTYRGASALALGYSKVSDNGKVILKVTGGVNNAGHYMGGASVGFKF